MRQYDVEIKINLIIRVDGENEDIAKENALAEVKRNLNNAVYPTVSRRVSVENVDDYYGD